MVDSNDVITTTKVLKYGSYYVAYEAQCYGKQCMAKKEHKVNEISKLLLKREREFLALLKHPCVTEMLTSLGSLEFPVLLMEKMWMSLTEYLISKKSLTFHKISILHDVACALHYIHTKGIVHCDLHGDNILLTEDISAKLTDFGRATFQHQKIKYFSEKLDYMPPEMLEPYSVVTCSAKVDIFSFGCVIIHTFTQEDPTPDLEKLAETPEVGKYQKLSEVKRRKVCLKKLRNSVNSIRLNNMVLRCLQDNPDHRPTAKMLLLLLKTQLAQNISSTFHFGMCITIYDILCMQ